MKLRVLVATFVVLACCAVACSLNPQPLPPGTYDAGGTGLDASKGDKDGSTTFGDAGGIPEDGGRDAGQTTTDAGEDASDASDGGELDASDAEVDAAIDAPNDVVGD